MWSWKPGLRGNVDQTFQLLQDYTTPVTPDTTCGTPAEGDYASGYGKLNLMNGKIIGTVTLTNSSSSLLAGALVQASRDGVVYGSAWTNGMGEYTLLAAPGTYTVTATKYAYTSASKTGVTVNLYDTIQEDFALTTHRLFFPIIRQQ